MNSRFFLSLRFLRPRTSHRIFTHVSLSHLCFTPTLLPVGPPRCYSFLTMATDSGASGPPLQKTETTASFPDYGYPQGHLGHLDETQAEKLEEFRKLVETEGLYKPGPPPSHDDEALLYAQGLPQLFCAGDLAMALTSHQAIPARTEVGSRGSAEAVPGHARVAPGQRHRHPLQHHRARLVRAEPPDGGSTLPQPRYSDLAHTSLVPAMDRQAGSKVSTSFQTTILLCSYLTHHQGHPPLPLRSQALRLQGRRRV